MKLRRLPALRMLQGRTRGPDALPRAPKDSRSEERFNRLIAILTMTVALIVAIVAYLQTDSTIRSDRYSSLALQYAMQATGARSVGTIKLGFGHYTYQVQDELQKLAQAAEDSGDDDAVRRYQTVWRDLARLSPLLSTYDGDEARYASDLYIVQSTAHGERFAEALKGNDAWEEKARAHIMHLAFLAVALVLFGLASTIGGTARNIFLVTGCVMTAVTVISTIMITAKPITPLPDEAIDAYARGLGLAYQNKVPEAVAAFDEALAAAPDYHNARFVRARTWIESGDYAASAADYELLQSTGRDDANVNLNLGWVYYLMGRFDDAVQTANRALERNPDPPTVIGIRLNLAIARLAAGQIDEARAEYAATMAMASQAVAQGESARDLPYSFWEYLDACATDLDSLIDRLGGKTSAAIQAPPRAAIANPAQVSAAANELTYELKSLYYSLERTGQPPRGKVAARVSEIEFASDEGDDEDEWEVLERFPSYTTRVVMLFDFEGIQPSQPVSYRVYRGGREDLSLRRPINGLGTRGQAEITVPLLFDIPGEYLVEIYVDYQLVQRGRFTIEED